MLGRWLGDQVRKRTDLGRPMGSWTGLPAAAGAPLSGALHGLGAGALFSLGQKATGEKKPNWKRNLMLGAGGGLGVGLLSALLQGQGHAKTSSTGDTAAIVSAIMRDQSLPAVTRAQLVNRVSSAGPADLANLMRYLSAAGGASIGYMIARFFGMGLPGSVISATLGGAAAKNFLTPKVRYV
jgi:hypothetical protein